MRRSHFSESQTAFQAPAENIEDDETFSFDSKKDARLQEILSSPQVQRELEMLYERSRPELMRELLRMQQLHKYNESLTSLNDSEFYYDDQDAPPPIVRENVAYNLTRASRFLEMLSRLPLPRMSFTGMGICFLIAVFFCPRACCENILFPAFRLGFGTLYPAYASYKAVRTKNVKEYVKWMMYWIVYAFFTCIETFTDIFLAWFPFYYEVKVIIVLWLLSPATKGSSTLYRKFVHPMLTRREQEIDEYLNQAKERGYTAVLQLGSKGVNYATNVIMQTALKGGGNLVQTIRRSYSLSDLSEPDVHRTQDEIDEVTRPQRALRPRSQTMRSSSGGRHSDLYFPEVDVGPKAPPTSYNYIRSSEDISSGYSSAEPISGGLSRTSSMTNTRSRFKAKRAEDDFISDISENDLLDQIPYQSSPKMSHNPSRLLAPGSLQASQATLDDIQSEILTNSGSQNMPTEMVGKYEMFCKWLENNEKTAKSQSKKPTVQRQISEDEFKDTISVGSEDEVFVDVKKESKEIVKDIEVVKKDVKEDLIVAKPDIKEDLVVPKKDTKEDLIVADIKEEEVKILKNEDTIKSEPPNEHEPEKTIKSLDAFAKVIVEASPDEQSNNTVSTKVEIQSVTTGTQDESSKITSALETTKSLQNSVDLITATTNEIIKHKLLELTPQLSVDLPKTLLDEIPKSKTAEVSKEDEDLAGTPLRSVLNLGSREKIFENVYDASGNKRAAIHGKGKAPEPPERSEEQLIEEQKEFIQTIPLRPETPSSKIEQVTNIVPPVSLKLPEPSISTYTSIQGQTHSRSPSPKHDGKKSKKKVFKNYLPSIFRSESSKSTPPATDDYHKETQI